MVSVKMERMFTGVPVEKLDLDHVVMLDDKGVGVRTVNGWVGSKCTHRIGGKKSGDLGSDVRDVVERSVVFTVRHGVE